MGVRLAGTCLILESCREVLPQTSKLCAELGAVEDVGLLIPSGHPRPRSDDDPTARRGDLLYCTPGVGAGGDRRRARECQEGIQEEGVLEELGGSLPQTLEAVRRKVALALIVGTTRTIVAIVPVDADESNKVRVRNKCLHQSHVVVTEVI